MQVSKQNVFMRISKFGFFSESNYPTDICSLTRRVFFSLLAHIAASAAVLSLLLLVLLGFVTWGFWITGRKIPNDFMGAMGVLDVLAVLSVSVGFGITKLAQYIKMKVDENDKRRAREERMNPNYKVPKKPKEPSLIPLMYKAWKNKFCVKIEVSE